MNLPPENYEERLAAESRKWGNHLTLEASGFWFSWLCHPAVQANYHRRCQIDGLGWPEWFLKAHGRPADRSLDLGCGSGGKSRSLHSAGASRFYEGCDLSPERIQEAERLRLLHNMPGNFFVADANQLSLTPRSYDLIFSSHSFHHFLALEDLMASVHEALTPDGYFILEEFVGPTQFQWTNRQMDLVRARLALIPERLRWYRWNTLKVEEGRPTPEEVMAESPFESIRSGEITGLFHKYFDVIVVRKLGGTLQQLLYNGIVHHFALDDEEAMRHVNGLCILENTLVDSDVIPSDFLLLVGKRKSTATSSSAG